MADTRTQLSPTRMERLRGLLDDARTLERVVIRLEREANALIGGDKMDWVLEYTANNPELTTFGVFCEKAGVIHTKRRSTPKRTLRRRRHTQKASEK